MYRLPPLPYAFDALEPAIAEWVVKRHYEDNHAGYYRKVNELIGSAKAPATMLELALRTKPYTPINNAAAQAWAHDFWWRSMSPTPTTPKSFRLIKNADQFVDTWIKRGVALFGSGWLWLVLKPDGKLDIVALPDAQLPQHSGLKPILVMDLWEHSYYCQYGTKRAEYLKNTLKHLNWAEAERRLRDV
jgi:Fe-Mn family superoxide dismutase